MPADAAGPTNADHQPEPNARVTEPNAEAEEAQPRHMEEAAHEEIGAEAEAQHVEEPPEVAPQNTQGSFVASKITTSRTHTKRSQACHGQREGSLPACQVTCDLLP